MRQKICNQQKNLTAVKTSKKEWWRHEPDTLRKGIGIVMHWKPSGWIVHRVLAGSPAATQGIKPGDVLKSINQYELGAKQDITEAFRVSLLKGLEDKAGSDEYTYVRDGKALTANVLSSTLRD